MSGPPSVARGLLRGIAIAAVIASCPKALTAQQTHPAEASPTVEALRSRVEALEKEALPAAIRRLIVRLGADRMGRW